MAARFSANEYVPFQSRSKARITDVQLPDAASSRKGKSNAHLNPTHRSLDTPTVNLELEHRAAVKAGDLMTANVVSIRPEDSIKRIARVMGRSGLGVLPVVDGSGRLIGTITERDIAVRLIARDKSVPNATVNDYMSGETFACSAEKSIDDCMRVMSWHQVRQIPIVDDDHKLIGIISRGDIARYLCEHSERVKQQTMTELLLALAS